VLRVILLFLHNAEKHMFTLLFHHKNEIKYLIFETSKYLIIDLNLVIKKIKTINLFSLRVSNLNKAFFEKK